MYTSLLAQVKICIHPFWHRLEYVYIHYLLDLIRHLAPFRPLTRPRLLNCFPFSSFLLRYRHDRQRASAYI